MANPGTANLVEWWKLDETSGTRYGASGKHNLTDYNTVGYASGKKGNAADFEVNNSEGLYKADHADYSFGNEDFSVGCWFKMESLPAANANYGLITKYYTDGNQREWSFDIRNETPVGCRMYVTNNGSSAGTPAAIEAKELGVWYFVVGGYDSVNDIIWVCVDAGEKVTVSQSVGCRDGTSQLNIGCKNNHAGSFMDGLIDEAFIFKKTLSADEISWLYNSGNGRTYEDLLGPPGIKTINGIDIGSIKTINGIAIADIKTIQGIT